MLLCSPCRVEGVISLPLLWTHNVLLIQILFLGYRIVERILIQLAEHIWTCN